MNRDIIMKESNPLISFITPCYNAARIIEQAIESVLSQPITSWEFILINDGSVDNTEEVCEKYLVDPRIKLINIKNSGAGKARNTGLRLARGKWIIFLDADDLLISFSLNERFFEKLNQYGVRNVDVIYTSSASTDIYLTSLTKIYLPETEYPVIPNKEFWTAIYKRDYLLNNAIFFYEYKEQDVETAFKYLVVSNEPKIVCDEEICFYLQRRNERSNTHTWNEAIVHSIKAKVYKDLLDKCNNKKYTSWLYDTVISEIYAFYYICCNTYHYTPSQMINEINKLYWKVLSNYKLKYVKNISKRKFCYCSGLCLLTNLFYRFISKFIYSKKTSETRKELTQFDFSEIDIKNRLLDLSNEIYRQLNICISEKVE